MDAEFWRRIKEIYGEALDLPDAEREAYLDRRCGGDAELRSEVTRLLPRDEPDDAFLVAPTPPAADDDVREITRQLGDFELVAEIGRGGTGIVYRARQASLQREVAVKVLASHASLDRSAIERLLREARATARLQHPGIVPIHFVGNEGDTWYFAMDYYRGGDLNHELAALSDNDRIGAFLPRPDSRAYIAAVCERVAEVADALQYAHEQGVVHRDVKPHNLLFDRSGRLILVDFGLARVESLGSITQSGFLTGTPYYMSPEQARVSRSRVDHRTDIYSLGVVLYEMLVLRRPFSGDTSHEVLEKIQHRPYESLRHIDPRIPRDLQIICDVAMSKLPEERYASAGEFGADLRRFLDHQAIVARPPSVPQRIARFTRAHRGVMVLAGVVALAATLGFVAADIRGRQRAAQALEADFRTLLRSSDWSTVAPALLNQVKVALEQSAIAAPDELREQLLWRFAQLRETTRAELKALPSAFAHSALFASDDSSAGKALPDLLRLRDFARLFPEDDDLQQLASAGNLYPRLSVHCADPGATVAARRLDIYTWQAETTVELGPTPIDNARLRPGAYRVIVSVPGIGFSEYTRYLLEPGTTELIDAQVRPSDSFADMIPIGGGTWLTGDPKDLLYPEEEREVRGFLIDATEVANRDYRRFLEATGRTPPDLWPAAYDPAWDDLPVIGVTWFEAQAFAEWVGKRLPTPWEWERAARGTNGRLFPWGNEPRLDQALGVIERESATGWSTGAEAFEVYQRNVAAVSSHEEARADGLYHMYGNVSEWTEGLFLGEDRGMAKPEPGIRVLRGGAFDVRRASSRLNSIQCCNANYGQNFIGFRCARSVTP